MIEKGATVKTAFQIGDRVVYPAHGVGLVTDITEKMMDGSKVPYYVINIPSQEMNILLPAGNAGEMGLRPLSDRPAIEKALSSLSERREMHALDWKSRQNQQQTLLRTGTIDNVALVVNILYNRQKSRDLPVQERKIFENALTHLVDETGFVLGLDEEETKRRIFSKLERIK